MSYYSNTIPQYYPHYSTPSAPPEEDSTAATFHRPSPPPAVNPAYSREQVAQTAEKVNKTKKPYNPEVNLEDDCSICCDKLKINPDGDQRKMTVIGRAAECGHHFHHYCIDKWLQTSAHADCPLCRTKLNRAKIIEIKLNAPQAKPAQPPKPTTQPVEQSAGWDLSVEGKALGEMAKSGFKLLGKGFGVLFDKGVQLANDAAKGYENRSMEAQARNSEVIFSELASRHKQLEQLMKKQKGEIELFLAKAAGNASYKAYRTRTGVQKVVEAFGQFEMALRTASVKLKDAMQKQEEYISKE